MSEADDVFGQWDRKQKVVSLQDYLPGMGPPGLPLVYYDDIVPSLDVQDFVEGLMVEQSAGVVYGESNSGKTFWMTDLALHVAAGIPWNGREVDQAAVIYVALEGGIGFRNRVEAWRVEKQLDAPVLFASIMVAINLLDPDADTGALIEAIRAASATLSAPVKLVVIDTLSRAMAGGNENAPDDMGALVMNMDRVRQETKAAVWFVHHSGKDQAKGARGHSLLRAAIDTEIEVVATGEQTASSRAATVVKQRELPKGDVFNFGLKVIDLGTNRRGKPVTSCVVENSGEGANAGASLHRRRLPQQQQRALEVLADLVGSAGQSGHPGTPADVPSVPEKWWRERFYERAMPGAEPGAKKMAFRRASDALLTAHLIGMSATRVWVVYGAKTQSDTKD